MKQFVVLLAMSAGLSFQARAGEEFTELLGASSQPDSQLPFKKIEKQSEFRKLIPSNRSEQNIFISFLDKGEFQKALYEWPNAIAKTSFAQTVNGRALYAYLLYKNGLSQTGRDHLIVIENPANISPFLLSLWKAEAQQNGAFWKSMPTTPFFAKALEIEGSTTWAIDQWSHLDGKTVPQAAQTLDQIMKIEGQPISQGLLQITAARFLYGAGYLDAAIKYYSKISNTSEYWFTAQEEKAWAYLRKGEPQNSLPVTEVITRDYWSHVAGPEASFLHALAQLKVCDYPGVAKTLKSFRLIFQPRLKALLELTNQADTPEVGRMVALQQEQKLSLNSMGADSKTLPRLIHRDLQLSQMIRAEANFKTEEQAASQLFSQSLAGGTATVGFQGQFEAIRQDIEQRRQRIHVALLERVKSLANQEIDEIKQILAKMQIVEAEVLQQVMTSEKKLAEMKTDKVSELKGVIAADQSKDTLRFAGNDELWFDEISHRKVDIKKACQLVR